MKWILGFALLSLPRVALAQEAPPTSQPTAAAQPAATSQPFAASQPALPQPEPAAVPAPAPPPAAGPTQAEPVLSRMSSEAPQASSVARAPRAAAYVSLEWRAFRLADHLSHGPAFSLGVSLLRDHLRVGLMGFGRPGPWNPAEFAVKLPDGVDYKGKTELSLRSDGAMMGAHVTGLIDLPKVPVVLELPLQVGYGGFGFYLHGEDRITPDGDRVSVWEDRLFQDTDSFLGVIVETGVRAALDTGDRAGRPYVGLNYTLVPGYTSVGSDSYSGFSASLGVELGGLRGASARSRN